MAWSAENATRAYLQTMKMGNRPKQLDVSEFASALAAGNNAQLMVEACSSTAGPTTLALVAAAHQTGGRVVCILPSPDELCSSKKALGTVANHIEFVVGDAQMILLNDYSVADFVLIDCNMVDHEAVLRSVQVGAKDHGAVVMGYNTFNKGSWSGLRTVLLPIGGGLQVTRIQAGGQIRGGGARKSRWVVRVDQCTGEEHVFRVIPSHRKELGA